MKRLKIKNIHAASAKAREMPDATYLGFAIGAYSHHRELQLDLDGVIYIVSRGAPLVLSSPFKGIPIVKPVRKLVLQINSAIEDTTGNVYGELNAYQSRAEVLGLESCAELSLPVFSHAEAFVYRFTVSGVAAAAAQLMTIPWDGRKQALITANFVAPNSTNLIEVFGGIGDASPNELINDTISPYTLRTEEFLSPTALYSSTASAHIIIEDVPTYDDLAIFIGDGVNTLNCQIAIRVI